MRRLATFLTVALLLTAVSAAQAQDDWAMRRAHHYGAQIRIGRDVVVGPNDVVNASVIVVGGSVTINGRVNDDVVVIGGNIGIGPTARVRGDVVSIGGTMHVDDAADVLGEIHEVGIGWPRIRLRPFYGWGWSEDAAGWALFRLTGTVSRVLVIGMSAMLLALVAPGWVGGIERRVTSAPLASGAVGVVAELLFLPLLLTTVLALIVSIVGIPFLLAIPFLLLAAGVIWLAGFTAVAVQVGVRLRARLGWTTAAPVLDALAGVLLLSALTLIGRLVALGLPWTMPLAIAFGAAGFVIEYVAWTVGLGAALAARFQNRGPHIPRVPSPAPPSATS
jgi:hypothetical protein